MEAIIDFNVRKNCPKFFWYFLFPVFTLLILFCSFGGIWALVVSIMNSNLLVLLTVFFVAIFVDGIALFYFLGFINSRLMVYEDKVVYYNLFAKRTELTGLIEDFKFRGYYGYGFKVTSQHTGEVIKIHTLTVSVFLLKEFEKKGLKMEC